MWLGHVTPRPRWGQGVIDGPFIIIRPNMAGLSSASSNGNKELWAPSGSSRN
jgi:hypothetical protein